MHVCIHRQQVAHGQDLPEGQLRAISYVRGGGKKKPVVEKLKLLKGLKIQMQSIILCSKYLSQVNQTKVKISFAFLD